MKRIITTIIVPCIAILLAGCSNEFEDIFNDNNKEVIAPLMSDEAEGEILAGINYNLMKKTMTDILGANDKPACALVINNQVDLKTVVSQGNEIVEWPEIDFDKCSLVLGYVFITPLNRYLDAQRIVYNKGVPELYIKVVIPQSGGGDTTDGAWVYFARLYSKIQFEGEIVVKTWETHQGS